MGILKVIEDRPGFCKATFQGPQGSGKTFTAALLAIRIHQLFGSTKPVAFVDTEIGSDYVAEMIEKGTGHKPLRVKTRAFGDLMEAGKECVAGAADIMLTDSITHFWREIGEAHMRAVNEERLRKNWGLKTRMDIQDIMRVKERWQPWPDFFLNSPLHLIVCGREGAEWGTEENEETGKRELIQVGKKMKVEGEFGYEASLMVSMSIRQNQGGWVRKKGAKDREERPREIVQVCTVLKDRFDELNGQTVEMPEGEWFDPFLKRLNPQLHKPVDTSRATHVDAEVTGYDRAKADRDIALEKVEASITKMLPGSSAVEKQLKVMVVEACFGTTSWREIETRLYLHRVLEGADKCQRWMGMAMDLMKEGIAAREALEETKKRAFDEAEKAKDALAGDDLPPDHGAKGQQQKLIPEPGKAPAPTTIREKLADKKPEPDRCPECQSRGPCEHKKEQRIRGNGRKPAAAST